MKVLITGGAGFIGSHLVDKLIEKGYRVSVIDDLSAGKKNNLNPKSKFYKIDIRDSSKVFNVFKIEKPEVVFHYAARIDARKSVENPIDVLNVNILGSVNILQACMETGVKKIIFASTVGVYGQPQKLPIKENHPLNPISPYAVSKLAFEKILNCYNDLDFIILRYTNIYGSRQRGDGEGGVVSIFLNSILKNRRPTIFGEGSQTRDFLYVDDAVSAAVKAMEFSGRNQVYNVGTNKSVSVLALFKMVSELLQKNIKPLFSEYRQGDITDSRADFSNIKEDFKWQPNYNLKEGLMKTIKWF